MTGKGAREGRAKRADWRLTIKDYVSIKVQYL